MIFARKLRSRDHVKAFVVDKHDERGWEVREEDDQRVVKRVLIRDWHRVENAMMRFALQATRLEGAGWIEVPAML